jgi:hypothetical protein
VRLVLRADRRGLPPAYALVPSNENEHEPLLDLVEAGETVIADKGLWGRVYKALDCGATIRTGAMAAESCSSAASRTTRSRLFTHACARGGRRPRRMDDARTFALASRQSAYWRSSSVSVAKHRAGQKPLLR